MPTQTFEYTRQLFANPETGLPWKEPDLHPLRVGAEGWEEPIETGLVSYEGEVYTNRTDYASDVAARSCDPGLTSSLLSVLSLASLHVDDATLESFYEVVSGAGDLRSDRDLRSQVEILETDVLVTESRIRALEEKIERLDKQRQEPSKPEPAKETDQDFYEEALRQGRISEGRFNGLGYALVPPQERVVLYDTLNRNVFLKALVLDSTNADRILVESVTVAGIPLNVGSSGAPLSAFQANTTQFGLPLGRQLALSGQDVTVTLRSLDPTHGIMVSGGFVCSEIHRRALPEYMERFLDKAADSDADPSMASSSATDSSPG